MIPRTFSQRIKKYRNQYPALAVVGPWQSSKTTVESIDYRQRAEGDPRGFLDDLGDKAVLDEIQRVPDIFSYLQEYVDERGPLFRTASLQKFYQEDSKVAEIVFHRYRTTLIFVRTIWSRPAEDPSSLRRNIRDLCRLRIAEADNP